MSESTRLSAGISHFGARLSKAHRSTPRTSIWPENPSTRWARNLPWRMVYRPRSYRWEVDPACGLISKTSEGLECHSVPAWRWDSRWGLLPPTVTWLQRFACTRRAVVALLDYRLAPEYRFPVGLKDIIEAYRELLISYPAGAGRCCRRQCGRGPSGFPCWLV